MFIFITVFCSGEYFNEKKERRVNEWKEQQEGLNKQGREARRGKKQKEGEKTKTEWKK
jgi:hypothetical protein